MSNTNENYMLTTVDNPFSPFTHFDEWNAWDMQAGYHTLSFLARIAHTSPEFPVELQEADIDAAIDEIVRENVSGMHVKISESERPRVSV